MLHSGNYFRISVEPRIFSAFSTVEPQNQTNLSPMDIISDSATPDIEEVRTSNEEKQIKPKKIVGPKSEDASQRNKLWPRLRHMEVLEKLIENRLRKGWSSQLAAECRICRTPYGGSSSPRSIVAPFARQHLYDHFPELFGCGVCVRYRSNSVTSVRNHIRTAHPWMDVDNPMNMIDRRSELDESLTEMAQACFGTVITQTD